VGSKFYNKYAKLCSHSGEVCFMPLTFEQTLNYNLEDKTFASTVVITKAVSFNVCKSRGECEIVLSASLFNST